MTSLRGWPARLACARPAPAGLRAARPGWPARGPPRLAV